MNAPQVKEESSAAVSGKLMMPEFKGFFLVSFVETLAEFKNLGRAVLQEHNVYAVDIEAFYPMSLRNALYQAVFDRFGRAGVRWSSLQAVEIQLAGSEIGYVDRAQYRQTRESAALIAQAAQPLAMKAALEKFLYDFASVLNKALSISVKGIGIHGLKDLKFLPPLSEVSESEGNTYNFTMVFSAALKPDFADFPLGNFLFWFRHALPENIDFNIQFLPEQSTQLETEIWDLVYQFSFTPMPPAQSHATLYEKNKSEARNELFKEAIDFAFRKEDLAKKAHENTLESIRYAATVQKNRLPRPAHWAHRLKDLAVLWAPKDIIGGDIWWLGQNSSEDISNIALIDCTGHGVPGAMTALLVSHALEKAAVHKPGLSPKEAVLAVQEILEQSFAGADQFNVIDNGCDMVAIQIDRSQNTLKCCLAGLRVVLWNPKSNSLEIIDSSCGGLTSDAKSLNHLMVTERSYETGSRLLLYTDGLTDQVGSAVKRSFGHKRLYQLFLDNATQPVAQILETIEAALNHWQGHQERRDDVTVLCIEL